MPVDFGEKKLVKRNANSKQQRKNPDGEQDNHGRRDEKESASRVGFLDFFSTHPGVFNSGLPCDLVAAGPRHRGAAA
jgi:hypothetical protein